MQDSILIDIGLPLGLAIVMVGIGLTLQVQDFTAQRRSPLGAVVGSLGQLVGVPLLGFLVAWAFDMSPARAIGMVLVAATPRGSTSNVICFLGRGRRALPGAHRRDEPAGHLHAAVRGDSGAGDLGRLPSDTAVSVGFGDVAGLLMVIIFVPIVIGMTIRIKKPALAARLERLVSLVSMIILLVLILGILVSLGSEAWTMLRAAGPACLVLSALAMALGVGMGMATRVGWRDQLAFASEMGAKNVTLSMLIGLSTLKSEEIALPSAIYGPIMYIPALAMVYLFRRNHGAAAPETEPDRRPILVGFDGVDPGNAALRWAASEAAATERPLRGILAWGMPTLGVTAYTQAADLHRPHAEAVLDEAVRRLREAQPGVDVEGELFRGKPAQILLDRSADAAMVVVGNHTRSNLGRLVMGSVSSAVVTHADVPVVLVRRDVGADGQPWRQGPVVVGVDGSAGSEAAVTFAVRAAVRRGGHLMAGP